MCLDPLTQAQMKSLNFAFDRLFGTKQTPKPESDELAQRIAAATDRDIHTMDAWITALREDVAYDDTLMRQLMALAMEGDDMQFGVRLAQAIRRQVIKNATEDARDAYEEEQDHKDVLNDQPPPRAA